MSVPHPRIAREPLTLEAFLALPESNLPTEVVDGQLVVSPSPLGPHQLIVVRVNHLLAGACPPGFEVLDSPIDWVLWEAPRLQTRQPDVVVVPFEEAFHIPLRPAPLLAVEVLSGDSFERDVVTKRAEYVRAGLRHYWVAAPPPPPDYDPAAVEVVVYEHEGGELVERVRAAGDELLRVERPFPVAFRPGDLVRPRR